MCFFWRGRGGRGVLSHSLSLEKVFFLLNDKNVNNPLPI